MPLGSFKSTRVYHSSDSSLEGISFCRFNLNYQTADGIGREVEKIFQREDLLCMKYLENCDGHLAVCEDERRHCTFLEMRCSS